MKTRAILMGSLLAALATSTSAAPHIGMKLACKRYGEAWNSGSRSAVMSVVTGDFASVWARVPADAFASMPRGGGGGVMGSSKGRGSGTVTVSTSQGALTFVLVGGGFNWTVADIYKAGDDGQSVSLKSYLDVVCTSSEFINGLKAEGHAYHGKVTENFSSALAALSSDEMTHIRAMLPSNTKGIKPYVSIGSESAIMSVRVPNGGPNDKVTFRLARSNGWRVDDYEIRSGAMSVPSFKSALPLLAATASLKQFVLNPDASDPTRFTSAGDLRDLLVALKAEKPFPMKPSAAKHMSVSEDGQTATIIFPDRQIHVAMGSSEGHAVIDRMWILTGDRWADFAHVMSLRRQLRTGGLSGMLANLRTPRATSPVAATQPEALATPTVTPAVAVAAETQSDATTSFTKAEAAAEPVAAAPAAAVASEAPVALAVESTTKEEAPAIQPVTYRVYQVEETYSPRYSRRMRHRRR